MNYNDKYDWDLAHAHKTKETDYSSPDSPKAPGVPGDVRLIDRNLLIYTLDHIERGLARGVRRIEAVVKRIEARVDHIEKLIVHDDKPFLQPLTGGKGGALIDDYWDPTLLVRKPGDTALKGLDEWVIGYCRKCNKRLTHGQLLSSFHKHECHPAPTSPVTQLSEEKRLLEADSVIPPVLSPMTVGAGGAPDMRDQHRKPTR